MGLFGKDAKCAFCGKEAGLLGKLAGYTLADGAYLCPDCREKCTPCDDDAFEKMTVADVRASMETAKALREGAQSFKGTKTLFTGRHGDVAVIEANKDSGQFKPTKDDGWVYNLNDVFFFSLNLETSRLDEDEIYFFGTSDYPELPKCPKGCSIDGASPVIWFSKNDLGSEKLEIDLVPSLLSNRDDIRGAYQCAHEFFELMKDFRSAQK